MPAAEPKFELLTDGNFPEWKMYMEALLLRKGLLAVVEGTERHPGGNEGTKKVKDYYRKQAEGRAEIILHVSPTQLGHCRDPDPYLIWTALSNVHQPRGRSTILALHRCFHRLRLKKAEPVTSYISRARHLAFLLQEAGVTISNDDLILAVTAGLPHSYDNFLLSLNTLPDSEYTFSSVVNHLNNEFQRQHMYSAPSRDTMPAPKTDTYASHDEALSVAISPSNSKLVHITCFRCGQKGHYQSTCRNTAASHSPSVNTPELHAAFIEDSDEEDLAF